MIYNGIAGSGEIAAGRAYVFKNQQMEIDDKCISPADVNTELHRLDEGIRRSKAQLAELKEKVSLELDENKALIFEAHMMMLEDPEFVDAVREAIRIDKSRAVYAVQKIADFYI